MYPTFRHQSFESNRMNCKLSDFTLTTMLAAVGMVVMAGTASAQNDPIPGDFFAFNSTNTAQQGGGAFSSGFGFSGTFRDASGALPDGSAATFDTDQFILVGGNSGGTGTPDSPGTGGFVGSSDDLPIVTTLTGLEAGTYDVRFVYSAPFGNGNLQYATGFAADATTQLQDTNTADRYLAVDNPNATFVDTFGSFIGETTVGTDGLLRVYTDILPAGPDVFFNNNAAINGLSLVQTSSAPSAIPEPSSVVLLMGIGGFGLLRRRKF